MTAGPPGPAAVAILTTARGWRGSAASLVRIGQGLAAHGVPVRVLASAPAVRAAAQAAGLPVASPGRGLGGLRAALGPGRVAVLADKERDARRAVLAAIGRPAAVVLRYNYADRPPLAGLAARAWGLGLAGAVFQCEFARREALRTAPWLARRATALIPNGFDAARWAPDPEAGRAFRAAHGIAPSARVVALPGILEERKRHAGALAALATLAPAMRPVCVVAGDGPLHGALAGAARAAGLDARFTGPLDAAGMAAALNAADVVVHASRMEMLPNAVAEAMLCGRPVVATDAGGTRELTGDDGLAAVLVPVDDGPALAAAVAALLADPARRAALGAAARARISGHFPLDAMAAAYARWLPALAEGRGR